MDLTMNLTQLQEELMEKQQLVLLQSTKYTAEHQRESKSIKGAFSSVWRGMRRQKVRSDSSHMGTCRETDSKSVMPVVCASIYLEQLKLSYWLMFLVRLSFFGIIQVMILKSKKRFCVSSLKRIMHYHSYLVANNTQLAFYDTVVCSRTLHISSYNEFVCQATMKQRQVYSVYVCLEM